MSELNFITLTSADTWRRGIEIAEKEVDLNVEEPRNLIISEEGLSLKSGSPKGIYLVRMDSNVQGCVWHRLILNAQVHEGTLIEVTYYSSEKESMTFHELLNKWSEPLINPNDALILGQKGRYLWIKIVMKTMEKNAESPTINSLKVFFPRLTYLRYLPAIYQEDSVSREFLERFLSVFESVLLKTEQQIDDIPRLFDAQATPSEFLSWLSTWIGAIRDENWSENRWRNYLSKAVQLYKFRGTKTGLSELIKLYSGVYPIIVERALLNSNDDEFEKVLDRLFGCRYSFCVLMKSHHFKEIKDIRVLKRWIEQEKPAHTCGGLAIIKPGIRLDWHTYLGLNTYILKPNLESRIGKAILSVDSFLANDNLK